MSDPRAVGHRASYSAMPALVRDWVEATLGSPVVTSVDQTGGFSPGCATRVRCADGGRAFVKAVGIDLNPDTPTLFRREILALTLLGAHPLWADLLASYDDGDWVILLLEGVEGVHPDLGDDATMARLLDATDELTRVLGERVPDPPVSPAADVGGLRDLPRNFVRWGDSVARLAALPPDLAPRWLVERADEMSDRVLDLAAQPTDHLVHWDIRNDNLLVRHDGSLVFVDWGQAGVGPDWLDPLLARVERVHLPWFDASLATSPALLRVADDAVTAWLVGFGAFLAWRAHTAVDINLPTLSDFRRHESARLLAAAARRLGV